MLFPAVLLSVLPLTLAVPLAAVDETNALESRIPPCSQGVHILATSGHGASIRKGYGLLSTTVDNIKAAVPNSSNYSTPYPKNSDDYPTATNVAAENLSNMIASYSYRCPNTPLVVLGYSEGAIGTMNALCGSARRDPLNSYYSQFIIATIVYGDETRVPGQSYDLGSCKVGHGVAARANPAGCKAFASNMQSYCDAPDPQCCGGDNQTVHYTYPATYNGNVASFVKAQYAAYISRKAGR